MDANSLLKDCVEFMRVMGKSKKISIDSYYEDLGVLVLRDTKGRKVAIKVNKGSNTIDIGIYIRPYKKGIVEVLYPYKKHISMGLKGVMSIVDDAFIELNKEN